MRTLMVCEPIIRLDEAVKLREEYEAKLSKVEDKKKKLDEQIGAIQGRSA